MDPFFSLFPHRIFFSPLLTSLLVSSLLSSPLLTFYYFFFCCFVYIILGPTPLTTTERPRKAKIIETGGIPFGTKVWASVLDYADFLLINVAGDNTKHLDKIKSSPIGLDLRHIDKIRFNFNKTVDRDHYKSLNVSRRKGTNDTVLFGLARSLQVQYHDIEVM